MYIEQGRKGSIGLWKYLFPPIGFLGLMALNILMALQGGTETEAMMHEQIEKLGKPIFFLIAVGPFVVFLGALFFWVKFVHQQRITSLTTVRKKIDWKRVFFIFTLMSMYIIITTGIDYWMTPEQYELNFELKPFLLLLVMAILLIPIQTSFEEYFFRAYLMQGLGLATKWRWVPLVVSPIIFGLMHIANPEVAKLGPVIMVYYIGSGLFLSIITLMDDGLELALGFHAANNLVTALLVTSSWTAFQTDSILLYNGAPESALEIVLPVCIVFPVLILILAKKYKWTGWKGKLFGRVLPSYTTAE